MSLLHDQDYVISHLRATYLEACPDGVGERIIRPSHLYITKAGPRRLNWAASTLISKARPQSPPIPTDTLQRAMPQMRTNLNEEKDDELSKLREEVNASFPRRRRASTLPSQKYSELDGSQDRRLHRGSSTENLRAHLDSDDDDDEDEETTLKTVYEHEYDGFRESDDDDDDVDGIDDDDDDEVDDDEYDDSSDGVLSGLSEEDDSDIEEEMQLAALQIKRGLGQELPASINSDARSISVTTSPRRRRKDKRQRSVDTSNSPTPGVAKSRARALSTRSGNSDTLYSPQIPFKDESSTGASLTETLNQEMQGLGLSARERSGSLLNAAKPPLVIKPVPIKPQELKTSKLSSAIVAKQATFDNPLEQYIAASGKSDRRPVRLKMFMPICDEPKKAWEAVVRPDCSTHLAIGFALYTYTEQKRTPALSPEQCDANYWNLRIVEDDGEPDEDFPALDRTRQISAYQFDEFALVPATAEQKKDNERKTPNAKRPTRPAVPDGADMVGLQAQQQDEEVSPESAEIKVFKYPFNEMTSPLFWSLTAPMELYVGELLERLCAEKILDSSAYAFKVAGTRIVVSNEARVNALQGQYTLELTPKRVMTAANGYAEQPQLTESLSMSHSFNNRTQNVYTALAMRGAEEAKRDKRKSALVNTAVPEVLNTSGYLKYMVWRRQPMSFISRHERVLALDGEYVHIMPSEERTFFDSPKTSSFHISQVLKCKQSRKVPANFKIVVRKESGPKRYDLESISAAQAAEIVAKIKSLAQTYRNA